MFSPVAPPPLCAQRSGVGHLAQRTHGRRRRDLGRPPGRPAYPRPVGWALDFDVGDLATSPAALADHRNCSYATILVILEQLRGRPMISGTSVVAIGVGSGLTAAAMLFRSG